MPSRLEEPGLNRDELVLVDEVFVEGDKENNTVYDALLTTKELAETHLRLENQNYVKVATDETFEEAMPGWGTGSTGVLSKQYGETTFPTGREFQPTQRILIPWCGHSCRARFLRQSGQHSVSLDSSAVMMASHSGT